MVIQLPLAGSAVPRRNRLTGQVFTVFYRLFDPSQSAFSIAATFESPPHYFPAIKITLERHSPPDTYRFAWRREID